jgi:signal transduction histidine kinase
VNIKKQIQAEVLQTYANYERQITLKHLEVGCYLVMLLMPLGIVLDYFVYPGKIWYFFALRLAASCLALGIWGLLRTPFSQKLHQFLSLMIALIPAFFICWMIAATEGTRSPYYAGLNLVLVCVALIMRWTVGLSAVASLSTLAMYLAACIAHGPLEGDQGHLVTNLYFLVLTSGVVIAGGNLHRSLRIREFMLRYELDKNKQMLEESNRKLVELDKIKSRFFANISHELRTPLTLLLAPLENLLHRFNRSFDQETRELLVTMHSNGMRLLKLINDLLDLVRMESGRMEIRQEPLEITEFMKGLASAARQVADDKRLKLETFVDPRLGAVLADRDKLEKIVLNLVFNALKFTPSGGRVSLRAEIREGTVASPAGANPAPELTNFNQENTGADRAEGPTPAPDMPASPGSKTDLEIGSEQLVITVADTGMGISEKNLPFVFDRFWQADGSSKRKYQGVGIGLALVKELTEIQGGKASVQSQEGKGTTFTVCLPYRKAEREGAKSIHPGVGVPGKAAPDSESLPSPAQDQNESVNTPAETVSSEEWLANLYRRAELFPAMTPLQDSLKPVEIMRNGNLPKLLVADDEPDMLRFLKSQLCEHYQVLEAVDGQQAIEKASQFLPDIILLDMMMPEKDGLQACREIREKTSTQGIPIILLTARADEETKLTALEAGASDFLAKPFSTTELHVRIKNLVESHQYQRKVSQQNQVLESTIEQLKETEMQLVQTEKLASLGRMSAGIIHEINNPLNYATTGLFTLRNKGKHLAVEHREEYAEILNDVEEGIKRVKTIVSDLRMFTHPDTESRDQVEVADVVAAALRFLSNEWKDRVRIEQNIAEHQTIWANKNKLIHVLTNLLQNSIDAFKKKSFEDEKPTIWIDGRIVNGSSLLSIRDNGAGIAAADLDKIFDPFFTTKDVGEGMGLGLSICYRIVQEYEGRILVKTEPGKFCEFTLEFPVKG